MKKTKSAKGNKNEKKDTKAVNTPETPNIPFTKEVKDLMRAHKKLFFAIASDCKSRVQTMAAMYSIHAALTNLEFEDCNKIFAPKQAKRVGHD